MRHESNSTSASIDILVATQGSSSKRDSMGQNDKVFYRSQSRGLSQPCPRVRLSPSLRTRAKEGQAKTQGRLLQAPARPQDTQILIFNGL